MDHKKRSLLKAIIYKTASVVLLALIAWIATGDLKQMSVITISYQAIAIAGYFIHERLWARIKWGIQKGD